MNVLNPVWLVVRLRAPEDRPIMIVFHKEDEARSFANECICLYNASLSRFSDIEPLPFIAEGDYQTPRLPEMDSWYMESATIN